MIILAETTPNPANISNDHFTIIVGGLISIVVALITFAGLIVPLLLSTRRDARGAKEQTTNNHDSNLRDDIDDMRKEIKYGFNQMGKVVVGLIDDVREIRGGLHETNERIDEETKDRKPK